MAGGGSAVRFLAGVSAGSRRDEEQRQLVGEGAARLRSGRSTILPVLSLVLIPEIPPCLVSANFSAPTMPV